MNHKTQQAHLGSAALVELNGTLLKLGLLIELVPSKVDKVVTEVPCLSTNGNDKS
jgi:hypothetical protein